ncbi:toll/interleukin-1 receptor domain-containing protein [Nocardia nepalensis]|uniref:toll/interleukin-1 receptor domain-containing protein n=1 Tax=Nocardia nepalensis TaxID=3375448 RepID=UPI003B672E0E
MEIFLSYRIVDSVYAVREISKQMAHRLGRTRVFRDQDSLGLGAFYARRIRKAVAECDMMVAVIGPHWLDVRDELGRRRIDDERDWVRMEIRTAFARGIPVIPVLLDGTPVPPEEKLPADIRQLVHVNFWEISHQTLEADVDGLIDRLVPSVAGRSDDRSRAADPSAGYTQTNVATNGGVITANNNGNQTVEVNGPRRR